MHKTNPNTRILIKAIVLTSVILISYCLGSIINSILKLSDNYISGMWCAVSAIVVFDELPDNAKKLMKDRLLGTFVGALLTTSCVFLLGKLFLSITISVLLVCLFIIFFKWDGALKIGCITVLIVGVTTHGAAFAAIWQTGLMRFLESAAGGFVSLAATYAIDKYKGWNREGGHGL